MAVSLISAVWPLDVPMGQKFVLVAICDAANDDGACFLCVETISYKCGMSVRTVQGHLLALESAGFISREERLGRSSIYTVIVDALAGADRHPAWVKRQTLKSKTPAKSAGVRNLHPTPAESAPTPAKSAGAPAESAPLTITHPSTQSSIESNTGPVDLFDEAWLAYPKRSGGNSRRNALIAWNARIKQGCDPEAMLAGVKRYARWCAASGCLNTKFIKQASTFFGPGEHWLDDYDVPAAGHSKPGAFDPLDYIHGSAHQGLNAIEGEVRRVG